MNRIQSVCLGALSLISAKFLTQDGLNHINPGFCLLMLNLENGKESCSLEKLKKKERKRLKK